jgi:NitT/TauT family transport system permease protein
MKRRDKERLAPWLLLIATLLLWEGICRGFSVSDFIFPSPSRIASQLWEFRGTIAGHAWRTFWVTMVGFGISIVVGTLLGFLIGSSRTAYAAIYPLMTGFNALPKAAFVPILVVWFGIGVGPAVLTAFLISFFPIVVNVATGLATIEPELEDVLKALGASKLDIMRKVGIPRTLPYFFGSLKIAITLAFVGSVISESIASNYGIGNLMLQAQAQFQVPLIFAGLIALAVEGIVMYWLMALLEARTTGWAQRSGFAQA